MLADPVQSTRCRRRRAAYRVYLFNLVLGSALGLAYLSEPWHFGSLRAALFAGFGLVSTLATVALLLLCVSILLAHSRLSEKWLGFLTALLWMLAQLALIIDIHVFRLFGYHFGSSALNLFLTPGSEDSFALGLPVYGRGVLLAALLLPVELAVWSLARGPLSAPADLVSELRARWASAVLGCAVLVAVLVEKSIYATAELERDVEVAAVSNALPLYPRLSLAPLWEEGDTTRAWPRAVVEHPGASLNYPRSVPALPSGGAPPDILVLVIDSWRSDAFDAEQTPLAFEWARTARRFDDHLSGGNATRFGVFSLLYGLHGSYWWPVLEQGVPPALVEALRAADYRFGVFSSASMRFPEFDRTAWSTIPADVHDDFLGDRQWERDAKAVAACLAWWRSLDEAGDTRPRFTFLLIDSAHQPYDFPDDRARFRPFAKHIDYAELGSSLAPEIAVALKNRYRNALLYADSLAGNVLAELDLGQRGARTLVAVTGDHGEEFAENGYWGHTGNFTPEQVAVPFLLRGPGIEPGRETRPTSHLDFAPTMLALLGCDPRSREDWSVGLDLLDPPRRRTRAVAAWTELGLWTDAGIVRVPRERSRAGQLALWTREWRIAPGQAEKLALLADDLAQLERECARFLAVP